MRGSCVAKRGASTLGKVTPIIAPSGLVCASCVVTTASRFRPPAICALAVASCTSGRAGGGAPRAAAPSAVGAPPGKGPCIPPRKSCVAELTSMYVNMKRTTVGSMPPCSACCCGGASCAAAIFWMVLLVTPHVITSQTRLHTLAGSGS